MTPQTPENSKSTGKLGRNPFASKPLKVGVKKTNSTPNRASTENDTSRRSQEFREAQASADTFDFKNAARGVRFLIQGLFYELTIKVVKKISDRIPT